MHYIFHGYVAQPPFHEHLTSEFDLLGLLCGFYVSIQKANDWRQNCTIRHLPLNSSELQ